MTITKAQVYQSFLAATKKIRTVGLPINPYAAAAQACLETGYGRHVPPGSHNVLGIKAGKSWKGPVVNADTFEFDHSGKRENTTAWWRVYPDVEGCFTDYGNIISRLSWYADARAHADGDPRAYLEALRPTYAPDGRVIEPGYFTDPLYVDKAMTIVKAYAQHDGFDQQYPLLEGVSQLWVNNVFSGKVLRARQVGHKLFVAVEVEGGEDEAGDGN